MNLTITIILIIIAILISIIIINDINIIIIFKTKEGVIVANLIFFIKKAILRIYVRNLR